MGRAQPRGGGRRALAAACLLPCACVEPDVDALAVWLEGTATRFELYDGGERRSMPFETVVADSDPSFLQIDVLPGGHGFLVTPRNDTMVWIDARDGGYAAVDYDARWGKLATEPDILDSGTAVTRWNVAGTGMVILPTVRGSEGPIWFEKPEVYALAGVPFSLRAPADGSVLYTIPPPGNGPGTIIVYQLRSSSMLELDRAEMTWRLSETSSGSLIRGSCELGACLAPEGDALLAMEGIRPCQPHSTCPQLPPYRCRVMRYRWAARPELGEPRIEALLLPDECHPYQPDDGNPDTPLQPSPTGPEILAALSQSVVILDDAARIYRADLDRRSWQSIPKLGVGPLHLFPVEQGHAALLLADNLQVIRADEHGLRIHSAEQMTCDQVDTPVVSPDGEWLLAICVRMSSILDFQAEDATRTIVRISSLGLEHFDGIAMRGLAIDDGGNALLYSFAAKDNDQAPRGLFVLDAAGHLARVDTLEPSPLELMPCAAGEDCYFSAQAQEE